MSLLSRLQPSASLSRVVRRQVEGLVRSLAFGAALWIGCAGAGASRGPSPSAPPAAARPVADPAPAKPDPAKPEPPKPEPPGKTTAPTPTPAPTPATTPAAGGPPSVSQHEAGLECMAAECFQVVNFPAISADGKSLLVLEVRTVKEAFRGALEDVEEVYVRVLDAGTGKVLREYPLLKAWDRNEAHQAVQDQKCVAAVNRTGRGDSRLCAEDPKRVTAEAPRFAAMFQKRVQAVQAELAKATAEALLPLQRAPGPGTPGAAPKPPAGGSGDLRYTARLDCFFQIEVQDPATGKTVASVKGLAPGAEGDEDDCDGEAPTGVTVWQAARRGLFLVSIVGADQDGNQLVRHQVLSRLP